MSLSINHNPVASNTARYLGANYAGLSSSIKRLSSGLRVSSSADDAAGLAIRELMRADIAALNQGMRNAADAISLVQTADGALSIIDEKLIRMKELAEQAATGTYNSDQRVVIDSEFQAMVSEIDRIAAATDFNGVKLLDGSLAGAHNGNGLNSTGAAKIHFGSGNDAAEDYYYVGIGACNARALLFGDTLAQWPGAKVVGNKLHVNLENVLAGENPAAVNGIRGVDFYTLPIGLQNIVIKTRDHTGSYAHKPHVNLFTSDGTQLTGKTPTGNGSWWNNATEAQVIAAGQNAGFFNPSASYSNGIINTAGQQVEVGGTVVTIVASQTDASNAWEIIEISEITDDLVFLIGGHVGGASCNDYDLVIEADFNLAIDSQDLAQNMLERINVGIVTKDKARAHLGSVQNRLENTVSNLQIQAENLAASESRISDVDVASEMTRFVKHQILAQTSVAMLSQANSLPQMAIKVIQS